jgi:uncharacterized membrane protein YfcA
MCIGVVLGALGAGGSILTLPMLVYAVRIEPKQAIASSLFVVGATSWVGMAAHAREGLVRWRVGGLFGVAAMAGAFCGGRIAAQLPAAVLLVAFGAVMIVSALAMLRGRQEPPGGRKLHPGRAMLLGAMVGLVSGLVGAGGGFMIVPVLTVAGGLAMREAIATSLLVIGMQCFAGFAGHALHVHLDLRLIGAVTAASMLGSVAGARIGRRLSPERLRRSFAWLVVFMGLFMFAKQLAWPVALGLSVVTLALALLFARRAASAPVAPPTPSGPPRP